MLNGPQKFREQIDILGKTFGDRIEQVTVPESGRTDVPVVRVAKGSLGGLLSFMKTEPGFEYSYLSDLTATDELTRPRFDLVYSLYSHKHGCRIRVKSGIDEGEAAPTATQIWPGANWAEREVWDMYGIRFSGHPDLRRILMDERWQGHPLRKDYAIRNRQLFESSQPVRPGLLEEKNPGAGTTGDDEDIWDGARTIVNIGVVHPATHGALRIVARLNGETVEKSYLEFGYTHRAKEKLGETKTYHQFIVYTDRLNYCSSLINNTAYAMAVEKLLGVEAPPRAVWIRMICCEISRVIDHLICVGINAVDLGAFSFFLYGYHQREEAYTLIEALCGARLTTSYTRVGGMMYDAPDGWERRVREWADKTRGVVDEMDRLLTGNKIWRKRTEGIGVFDREKCMQYSYSGPNARAAGIDVDLRRDQPCMYYKDIDFDIPLGENGDVFDRYAVRMEEMRESLRIVVQCAEKIKTGPVWCENKMIRIPEKDQANGTMEGLIHHFKIFMTGFEVPPGEAYTTFEAANGELGFYIVSKGGPVAHRMRIRGPSFWHFQGLEAMIRGHKIADVVAALGSINIIAGEIDR